MQKILHNRWHNHLDPNVKKSALTDEEERMIFEGYQQHGNKWAEIAKDLVGRTDNSIKNFFYATLRRQLRKISKRIRGKTKRKLKREQGDVTLEHLQKIMKENSIPYTDLDNIHIQHMLEHMDDNKASEKSSEPSCKRYDLYSFI